MGEEIIEINEDGKVYHLGQDTQGFEKELQDLINCHSQENASNTPDFILAQYLQGCLNVFNTAIQQRENWWGRDPRPSDKAWKDAQRPTGPTVRGSTK